MNEMTPEQLDAILDILIDRKVAEFEGLGIHVRFHDLVPEPVDQQSYKPALPEPRSNFEHPNLWPGGKPPTFYKK